MGVMSSPATGANARILLGNETALGQPVKNELLDRKICFTSESLAQTENTIESATICGCDSNSRSRVKDARGSLDVAGDISVEMSPEEYGRLIRHSMGQYLQIPNAIAAARGRTSTDADGGTFVYFSSYTEMTPNGGVFAIVYKDDNGILKYDDNAGAGYEFEQASDFLLTEAQGVVALEVGDSLTLEKGAFGAMFSDLGLFQVEVDNRFYVISYHSITDNAPLETFTVEVGGIFAGKLDPGAPQGSPVLTLDIPAGSPAYQMPGVINSNGLLTGFSDPDYTVPSGVLAKSGVWLYELWDHGVNTPGQEVYGHHFEIGTLPQGLTINVLRDTVGFLYSGMKVNEWTTTFDSQAYITSSWSFMGIAEYSVAGLARPAKIGDTTIYLNREPVAFRTVGGGTLTIGEEMKIRYGTVTDPSASASGLWEIGGIPATGDESIQTVHRIGENVDCSVEAGVPLECEDSPRLTSMEAVASMDYKLIEVLNGSITLSNNIGGDKYMLGSRVRAALKEGNANVSGSITVEFDDGQHYKRFIDGEYFDLEFKVLCEDPQYLTRFGVEAPVSVVYYMPQCKYTGTTPSVQDDSYLNTDMPFNAYDDTRTGQSASALTISVTNYEANNGI